ncbi:hypothetical protein PVAND_006842 [Polypedilum vanderplanki]|uniref:protein-histidine N-methyltransferase n=1 Tax=Polypedilum vanderplanki TaxID=319348 RepID=A0A9J6C4W2_POLVA|nr:hypothetical protein PVAND_006842 [Polypedilum vanderplanki]
MGKKSEKSRGKFSATKRNELKILADGILEKSREKLPDASAEYENYNEIYNLLERIIMIESEIKHQFKTSRSEEAIKRFTEWCKSEGAKFDRVEIKRLPGYGFGLIAKEPMKENEVFIEIPEKMIFSYSKIENHIPEALKQKVFLECPLFENMSVRLAIALMVEKMNIKSKFKPYFDVLPEKFRTVLYFTPKEMKELQGTSAFSPAIKQVKFIATQYSFLHNYLMASSEDNEPVLKELRDNFTYEFYRWAVSCVMTRQNLIPRENDEKESVLVPAWDMANHANGPINTQYNDEAKQIESFCLKDFDVNEQVTIAYGSRSNIDFLIHNGFVFKENSNRFLTIPIHLNKTDELHDDRVKLLKKIGLNESGLFQISPSCSSELLAFMRVFNMTKEQLAHWLNADNVKDLLDIHLDLDVNFQRKVCQSLLIRVKIILKLFPTTLKEDLQLLETGNLPKTRAMLIQYRVIEKEILHYVVASLENQIKLFNTEE